MAAPICLIRNPGGKKLSVNEEAIEILEKICEPLVVVSSVGTYRSGKSYLMNKLSGAPEGGFSLGDTVKANTKGIWMWPVPHPRLQGHTLLLLDTEGLGDVEKGDNKNDRMIMSLAMLMSSAIIYNSRNVINQDAVEKLYSVLKLHQTIMDNNQKEAAGEYTMASHFFWVVRDFTLKPELEGKPVTADEYLENCLKDIIPVKTPKMQNKNDMRKTIRTCFPERKCFLFDLPSSDKEVLANMDKVSEKKLQPAFVEKIKNFCQFIHEVVPAKTLRSKEPMTGTKLAKLIQPCVNAVTHEDISILETYFSKMYSEENTKTMERSYEVYECGMKAQYVDNVQEFQELHEASVEKSLQVFKKGYKKHEKSQATYEEQLQNNLVNRRENIWKNYEDTSRKKCNALIDQYKSEIDQAIKNQKYHIAGGHDKFLEDKNQIIKRYSKVPEKGVKAREILEEYLKELEPIENLVLKTDQEISAKKPKRPEVVDPCDGNQLTQYIQSYQLPTENYQHILIQLFGYAGHGKSSFVNSCLYVVGNDQFYDRAEEAITHGGKTIVRREYKLTDDISIVDNRGFVKLDSPEAWEMYAHLCNFVPLDNLVSWNRSLNERIKLLTKDEEEEKPDVIVPVLIYSSQHVLNGEEYENIRYFLKQAQKLTGILPFIILTKSMSGETSVLRDMFTEMGMENVYCVENYLQNDHMAIRKKHLTFLTFLKDVLDCVDFHVHQFPNSKTQQRKCFCFLTEMAAKMPST